MALPSGLLMLGIEWQGGALRRLARRVLSTLRTAHDGRGQTAPLGVGWTAGARIAPSVVCVPLCRAREDGARTGSALRSCYRDPRLWAGNGAKRQSLVTSGHHCSTPPTGARAGSCANRKCRRWHTRHSNRLRGSIPPGPRLVPRTLAGGPSRSGLQI